MRVHPFRGATRSQMRARIDDALLSDLDRRIARAYLVDCAPTDVDAGVAAGCDRRTAKRHLAHIIDVLNDG